MCLCRNRRSYTPATFILKGTQYPRLGDSVRPTAFHPAESMSVVGHARNFLRRSLCAAYGAEFFLYEKMGRRAIVPAGSVS